MDALQFDTIWWLELILEAMVVEGGMWGGANSIPPMKEVLPPITIIYQVSPHLVLNDALDDCVNAMETDASLQKQERVSQEHRVGRVAM